MTTIIAIANQKGGVGKTTTAVTLAHGLAMRGFRTLLIDLDTQGHCAVCLGYDKAPDLSSWLAGRINLRMATLTARANLDLIRSDSTTADLKHELSGRRRRENILASALAMPHPYDVVILDCAPSGDVLHDNALMAADYLLVPAKMELLSMDGLAEIMRTLADLRPDSQCQLAGIIPTFWVRTERDPLIHLEPLVTHYGPLIWPVIVKDAMVPVAARLGKTLWEVKKSRSRTGYESVMKQVEGLI